MTDKPLNSNMKTYLFAPKYDMLPGSIQLGDIIVNPNEPEKYISRLDTETDPIEPHMAVVSDSELVLGDRLWTSFSKMVASARNSTSRPTTDVYSVDALETLLYEPDREALEKRLQEDEVKGSFEGTLTRKRVYIVTGLRIAKGLKINSDASTQQESGHDPKSSSALDDTIESSGKTPIPSDIIFAYSLTVVESRLWHRKSQMSPYSSAVFM